MKYLSSDSYLSTEIVFLCEIDYLGRTYRFSSYPLSLMDNGSEIPFLGKMNDPGFEVSIDTIGGIKRQSSSVSLSLFFPHNVAQREMEGKTIERASARLFYVLSKNRVIQQNYAQKVYLFEGVITDPIYGHPEMDVGYVEFSIENQIVISDESLVRRVVGEGVFLESAAFSDVGAPRPFSFLPPLDPDNTIDVIEPHEGKVTPVVIGSPGSAKRINGSVINYGATPAYLLAYENSGTLPAWYVIAGHSVQAETVKFYDNKGNSEDNVTVREYITSRGQVYSFVILETGTTIDRTFVVNNDLEYWIEWNDGGGLVSPDSGRALSGAGDIIIWCLNLLNVEYDRQAFRALRSILNEYKFDGYINNEETKIFSFLQDNIVKYLPISIVSGAKGLTPIYDNLSDSMLAPARIQVQEGPQFLRISPLNPETGQEIINDLTVRFAPRNNDNYTNTVRISYRRKEANAASYEMVSPYSVISKQRYGVREQSISLDYVSDRETAIRIAQNIIRGYSLPKKRIRYRADFSFGYLDLGDVIELTDTELGLSSHRCSIGAKRYDGASWLYDIIITTDPILNRRFYGSS